MNTLLVCITSPELNREPTISGPLCLIKLQVRCKDNVFVVLYLTLLFFLIFFCVEYPQSLFSAHIL